MTKIAEPSLFDDLPVHAEVVAVAPRRPEGLSQKAFDEIKSVEDGLLEKAEAIVGGVMSFADIDPDAEGPPKSWVDELGIEAAVKKFRLAQAGRLSSSAAPVGIKVATAVQATIMKARAMEKSGPKLLNVQLVQMSAPLPEFPRRIVESNK